MGDPTLQVFSARLCLPAWIIFYFVNLSSHVFSRKYIFHLFPSFYWISALLISSSHFQPLSPSYSVECTSLLLTNFLVVANMDYSFKICSFHGWFQSPMRGKCKRVKHKSTVEKQLSFHNRENWKEEFKPEHLGAIYNHPNFQF